MTSADVEVAAPGKLVLAGEFAVLEGAPGVVMAVDRLVRVRRGGAGADDLVREARAAAARRFGVDADPGGWFADSDALRLDGTKLGLGSSAAVAVAAAASILVEAGLDVGDGGVRRRLWGVAREVHDAHQGVRGSGIDAAASLFGGFVAMRPRHDGDAKFVPWQPPAGLDLRIVWPGVAASTPDLLRAVRAWGDRDPSGYARTLGALGGVAEAIATAGPGDVAVVIEGFRSHAALLAGLGRAAGVALVPGAVGDLVRAAAILGGGAKPSGAGGGDCVVAAFPDPESGARFDAAARGLGARVLDLRPASRGVHAVSRDAP
jgi:phosphomevalonate kinase